MKTLLLLLAAALASGPARPPRPAPGLSTAAHRPPVTRAVSQAAPEPGKWRLPAQTPETSIAVNLPSSRLYLVGNAEPPTSGYTTANVNLRKDQTLVAAGGVPLDVNQGSLALVEAKSLAVVPARGVTTPTAGDYVTKTYEPTGEISFAWRLNGNYGPVLLADLNVPRNFRIFVKQVNPVTATTPATAYLFAVLVDGVPLPNLLASSTTSVDVYGKQVALQLRQYPPAAPGQTFSVGGSCVSW